MRQIRTTRLEFFIPLFVTDGDLDSFSLPWFLAFPRCFSEERRNMVFSACSRKTGRKSFPGLKAIYKQSGPGETESVEDGVVCFLSAPFSGD